jgi:hypothetical protein
VRIAMFTGREAFQVRGPFDTVRGGAIQHHGVDEARCARAVRTVRLV